MPGACASRRNSSRVRGSSRKTPRTALVTVREFCFSTPRIIMQRWDASMTTPTPCGCSDLHHRIGDLVGEPLLHLQPAREHLDDAGQLGETHDPAVGNVGDVRPPEERQHVVLAQGIDLDVPHQDHALVLLLEDRVAHTSSTDMLVAAREPAQRGFHPLRCLA